MSTRTYPSTSPQAIIAKAPPTDHQPAGAALQEEATEMDGVITEVLSLSGRIRSALLGATVDNPTRAPTIAGAGLIGGTAASLRNARFILQDARELLREIAQEVGA